MNEKDLRISLERYRKGEVGVRGAAAIADVSIARVMREANERGVRSNYDETDSRAMLMRYDDRRTGYP